MGLFHKPCSPSGLKIRRLGSLLIIPLWIVYSLLQSGFRRVGHYARRAIWHAWDFYYGPRPSCLSKALVCLIPRESAGYGFLYKWYFWQVSLPFVFELKTSSSWIFSKCSADPVPFLSSVISSTNSLWPVFSESTLNLQGFPKVAPSSLVSIGLSSGEAFWFSCEWRAEPELCCDSPFWKSAWNLDSNWCWSLFLQWICSPYHGVSSHK